MHRLKLVPIMFMAAFVTGCIGSTTYHPATPTPKNDDELAFIAGAYGLVTEEKLETLSPQAGVGVRAGLSENMDFGVRIVGPMLAGDVNIAVMNESDFAFSINPSFSTSYLPLFGLFWIHADVGLLADLVKTESYTITMGLKPGYVTGSFGAGFKDSIGSSGNGFTAGLTAGAKFKVGKTFSLMPSIDILTPVEDLGDGLFVNAGVGILF